MTLADRHSSDPLQPILPEEQRLLCPVCGVPEIHRAAHQRGSLHRARVAGTAAAAAVTPEVAVNVLRRLQPEVLRQLLRATFCQSPDPASAPRPTPAASASTSEEDVLLMEFPPDDDDL